MSWIERARFERPHGGLRTGRRVWLFRHGDVHADWHGRAYGGMDVPLSDRGVLETEQRAKDFASVPFRAVHSSPLSRARLLGERLARATGAPLELHDGLVEIARGEWQGRMIAELFEERPDDVARFYGDPWRFKVKDAENDADVFARAWPVFERALRAGDGPIAFTMHYNVIRVLLAYLLGVTPENSFRLRVDLSSACLLEDGPEGWRLVRSNVRSPLADRDEVAAG